MNHLNKKDDNDSKDILKSWNERFMFSFDDLHRHAKKDVKNFKVKHQPDLAKNYKEKFVSCSDLPEYINLLNDKNIQIIHKNRSVILLHEDNAVGAVIRDATTKEVSDYFGTIIKVTIDAHYKIKREDQHSSSGTITGHSSRSNRTNLPTYTYSYKDKNLGPNAIKIYEEDGNILGNWLFESGKIHLPSSVSSYEKFKNKVKIEDDTIIGPVFCTKNYEAAGHTDNDRSEWAIGYVYEEGEVKDGYFFYPEYGVAIEMTSNSIWCWLPQAVHGTAKLNITELDNRYTAVITLTEKTAKSIEKKNN